MFEEDSETDNPFLVPIEEVSAVGGRGTTIVGQIERGVLKVGDAIEIVGLRSTQSTSCAAIQNISGELMDECRPGDRCIILIRGLMRDDLERGQVMAKPGTVRAYSKFAADIRVMTKAEGGRTTGITNHYKPYFHFRTTGIVGDVELGTGSQNVMPGDTAPITVTLMNQYGVVMEEGLRFDVRDGGALVATGVVTKSIG